MADDPTARAALHWFVRLRGLPGPSAEERRAFARWLEADPGHRRSYAEAERAWADSAPAAEAVARDEAAGLERLLARMDAPAARSRRAPWRAAWAALAACLLLVLAGGLWLERPHLLQNLAADHVTGRGERRPLALADGSTVTLDADSAVTADLAGAERRVTLLRGRAFFDVARDGRPFVVQVPEGEIRVLGTRFDVNLLDGAAEVTVGEGRVGVGSGTQLTRGQQARLGAAGVGAVVAVDPDAVAAWRDGRLAFHDVPLAEVAAALERYRPGRILILDAALAGRRVSGSFPAADPAAALASLQGVMGFRLRSVGGALVLLD